MRAKSSIFVNGKYLLDTNIVIALLSGEQSVLDSLRQAEEVFIPIIAIGELYFGAAKSGRPEANRLLIDRFIDSRVLLGCDLGVAREYGRLKGLLKAAGTPLPENDIWIAAVALRHGLTIVSRDQHFSKVGELKAVSW